MGKGVGERQPGSSLAAELSHKHCFVPCFLAPSGSLLPLYFNTLFWEIIDQKGEMRDGDTCTH